MDISAMEQNDEQFMLEALRYAAKAELLGEVPVGAVIVQAGKIVCGGYNTRETHQNALHHAEIKAIAQACELLRSWRLPECELYVTLEPCPMCAGAIINSRIRRVVFGAPDPKAGCCGSVTDLFSLPFNHSPQVTGMVLERQCGDILSAFFKELRAKQQ